MNKDSVSYDTSQDQYYIDISLDRPDSVADAVIYGVADILDEDPISLPPLGRVVDTDSMTNLFHSAGDSTNDVSVSFEYSGFVVVVHSSGRIVFEEIE